MSELRGQVEQKQLCQHFLSFNYSTEINIGYLKYLLSELL